MQGKENQRAVLKGLDGLSARSVRNSFGFRPTERIVHPPNELADRLKFILWGFLRGIPLFYVTLAHYFGQFAR